MRVSAEPTLIALGMDGSVLWQQQAGGTWVTPLYATADGGTIVTSTTQCSYNIVTYNPNPGTPPCPAFGTLYTVDQNGNVTSQTPDAGAVYSWTNQWYDPAPAGGAVASVTLSPLYLAMTFAAILNGNASETGASVGQQPYAPLPSCYDTTLKPPVACPGPKEAIDDALNSLRSRLLVGPCPGCGSAFALMRSHGTNIFQTYFYQWLLREPRFYDGTRSSNRMNDVMCDYGLFATLFIPCDFATHSESVSVFMNEGSQGWMAAISRTPSEPGKGMLTFFDPAQVCKSLGSTPGAVQNQASIFHEALHGYTGLYDYSLFAGKHTLESALGIPLNTASEAITDYIRQNVLGGGATNPCGH